MSAHASHTALVAIAVAFTLLVALFAFVYWRGR